MEDEDEAPELSRKSSDMPPVLDLDLSLGSSTPKNLGKELSCSEDIARKQLTIIYNGSVTVYENVTEDMVKAICSLAGVKFLQNNNSTVAGESQANPCSISPSLGVEQARRASLARFLQKRRERAQMVPYSREKANSVDSIMDSSSACSNPVKHLSNEDTTTQVRRCGAKEIFLKDEGIPMHPYASSKVD